MTQDRAAEIAAWWFGEGVQASRLAQHIRVYAAAAHEEGRREGLERAAQYMESTLDGP